MASFTEVLKQMRVGIWCKYPDKWKNNWFLHHDNVFAHTSLVVQQFTTSKNITVIRHPPFAWLFPIPEDEITAERASFWHNWGDPRRTARGYCHTHIWELPGMHEIMGNMLGLLYTCPRKLLWRGQWKLEVTVRNFLFWVQFPEFLGSTSYITLVKFQSHGMLKINHPHDYPVLPHKQLQSSSDLYHATTQKTTIIHCPYCAASQTATVIHMPIQYHLIKNDNHPYASTVPPT